jgi:hypothetical protein
MSIRALFIVALTSVLGASASSPAPPAAPLDLGQGLSYVRLRHGPDDSGPLKAAWPARALVVDLRYPQGDSTRVFAIDMPARPPTSALFVLIGPGTSEDAVRALRALAPNLVTLGPAGPGLAPDVALAVKPEADRRAYDALDAGTPLETLIGEKHSEPRFNEAALAREHENGDTDEADGEADTGGQDDSAPDAKPAAPIPPPPSSAPTPARPTPSPPAASGAAPAGQPASAVPAPVPSPPPLKDEVLERAVQLHRTLLALGLLSGR